MIHKIYANSEQFKQIEFTDGLNVILADRKQESGINDTRNGVGKTTLIEIIHFCLGSNLNKSKLPIDEIRSWIFTIEMDICGERIIASRSIDNPRIIKIKGNTDKLLPLPELDPEDNLPFYKNDDWKKLLGNCLFGIKESTREKYFPTFRSLISYFIRRTPDAYTNPFKHFRTQKTWDWQVNNAFLLGLNWEHAAEAQDIRDKQTISNALNKAIKGGMYPTLGELESERLRLEREFNNEKEELSKFKVHENYRELQQKSNQLTRAIHERSNQNTILQSKLERYKESISSENAPDNLAVEELYKEAKMYFPDNVKKTLEEAKEFHETIIKNRREFLQAEISEIENQIHSIKKDIGAKTAERSSLMQVLKTHGALEEFTVLQERLLEKKEKLEAIKTKITQINEISEQKKKINEEKIELDTKIKRDYKQSLPNREKAVLLFNENSQTLYGEPGDLIINVSEKGYDLDVEIQRSNSEGISKMKIFCYDLMLVELQSQQRKIDFLIHDSTIFDGVDSRQRALALQHAHKKAIEKGFQYICAMNSDMVPYEDFESGFNIENFVRLELTDNDPSGSLLGFEF